METVTPLNALSKLNLEVGSADSFVLYADDDMDDRDLMQDCMGSNFPQKLLTFANGQDMLDFLNHLDVPINISLIILDINMPLMGGMETLQHLKSDRRFQDLPTVLFSTGGSPADKTAAKALGADIVVKSCSYWQMKNTVRSLLDYCDTQKEKVSESF